MKTNNRRPRSIAWLLAMWYALLSSVLIILFSLVMYSVLKEKMRSDDEQLLAGRIAELRAILSQHASDYSRLREEIEREASTSPGIYLQVLDGKGVVIAETGGSVAKRIPDIPIRPETWTAGSGFDWIAEDGNSYRIMSSHLVLDQRFTVHAAIDRTNNEMLLADFWRLLSIVGLLVVVIAVAMSYGIARKGLRPISRLAAVMDQLDVHRLSHRVNEEPWPEELQPLAQMFDGLLSRLEVSFSRLSQFSADIAHELRTPLHILRGEAELTLTRAASVETYRASIESAADEYDRLSCMVDALLFLARSEQPDTHIDRQVLDARQEVVAVFDFYQAMADEQDITFTCLGEGTISADSALLRRALGNLVANALRHTPDGGRITVEIRPQPEHTITLIVSDTGYGIPPEDLPRVLERFYRADVARPRQGQGAGSGLGLAIVQSIMHLHGGTISIHSAIDHGTAVTLMFPSATTTG
ncbi:HAMP domain-containing protein [Nitrosomonas sp. HPC101]|nr:heavy metal sensor histidine kinase [Nitrosomonas sp. HPC101]MXS85537.1 HAMP domain-containing protein [Nitrosomonas sp. HPC101]